MLSCTLCCCTCARSVNDRTRLLCLFLLFPESARGPRHLLTRPGPLLLPHPVVGRYAPLGFQMSFKPRNTLHTLPPEPQPERKRI